MRSSSSRRRTQQHLPDPPDPIELATRALSRHDRTRGELEERLAGAGVDEAGRERALETLERMGYVDDARVALARAEALASRGQGDEAIRFDLERRGVEPDVIAEALAALEPELLRAERLVERLGATPKLPAQLRRKGFSEEALEAALRHAGSEL